MNIKFYNIYHEEIVCRDKYLNRKTFNTEDGLIPPKDAEIKLNGNFYEVDDIFYNYDVSDVEVILKESY